MEHSRIAEYYAEDEAALCCGGYDEPRVVLSLENHRVNILAGQDSCRVRAAGSAAYHEDFAFLRNGGD